MRNLIQKYRLERHKTKPAPRQQKMFNCLSKLLHIFKKLKEELISSLGGSVLCDFRKMVHAQVEHPHIESAENVNFLLIDECKRAKCLVLSKKKEKEKLG